MDNQEKSKGRLALKILVINLMPAIGEFLFVTPVFKVIKTAFPEAAVHALTASQVYPICRYSRFIDKIITFDKKGRQAGLIEHFRLVGKLRKEGYDLVINLNPSERASFLAAFSGGKKICGFAVKAFRSFFSPYLERDPMIHCADSYLKALEELGIPKLEQNTLEMEYDSESEKKANRMWQACDLQNQIVVGIHPGANWPNKRWVPEYMAQLSDKLREDGVKTVFFGGEADLEIVAKVVAQCKLKPVIFTGKLNLPELAAMIQKCTVFVSADSGPMHIAASRQVPVVALFGPTNPKRYGPYHTPHRIIQPDSDCIMCGVGECKFGTGCMKWISPEKVYQGVRSFLES